MALGLTLLRQVGALPPGIDQQVVVSKAFQLKRAANEAKRLGDQADYLRIANIQRLSGWYENDYPRDAEITDAIIANTTGFGIADQQGKIIAKYKTFDEASRAFSGARVEMKVDVALPKLEQVAVGA